MAEGKTDALEKGEYVIGIAIILAALLVSATVYISVGGLQETISNLKLTAAAPSGGSGTGSGSGTGTGTGTPPAAPQVVKITGPDFSNAYFQGKSDGGKVILAEYSDFQCPYCKRAVPTMVEVKANYPNMKFIYRHFPLSFHQNAQKSAEAAECAGKQGKFWEMHDVMFDKGNGDGAGLNVADLKGYAATLKLDTAKFNACLDSGETAASVTAQQQEGQGLGISGTPGFIVYSPSVKGAALEAKLAPIAAKLTGLGVDATMVEINGAGTGIVFAGALPYANFKEIMDAFN